MKPRLRTFLSAVLVMTSCALFAQEFNYQFNAPSGAINPARKINSIAIDSDDRLFIADGTTKGIHVYDVAGIEIEVISTISTPSADIALKNPALIAIDSHNNLYIYDDALGLILVKPAQGEGFSFGEKGSGSGQFDRILDITVDSKGYCYVLSGSRKQVDVFSPDGKYLTWIAGTTTSFIDPIALGINGGNELYVMDKEGPNIYVYDIYGNLVNTNRSLANRKAVSLSKPIGMAVMTTGDFFLLDGASGQATLFNRVGLVMGTLGAKGTSAKGVFQDASNIVCSTAALNVAMLDRSTQTAQVFHTTSPSLVMKPETRRYKLSEINTSRPPAIFISAAPNGNRYVIPATDSKKVIAYKDSSSIDLFTINGKLEDAVSIAVDSISNMYVVDRGAEEVLMFDSIGTFIRKFGKEISDKLKDPTSIVIQRSGNIIVADHSRGSLLMWSPQGVFKKVITNSENSVIKAPLVIQVDSKDQIYVWDDDANCIYRIGSGGWPTTEKKVFARPDKPGGKPGTIGGFFIDPLDLIHVYNKTSGQLEVYEWDFEPLLKFSMGKSGSGNDSFGDVDKLLLDPSNLCVFFTQKKGNAQRAFQFMVPPPIPDGRVTYDVENDHLVLYFAKSKSPAVRAHGLIAKIGERDSVMYASTTSTITVEALKGDMSLRRLGFVSLSWSDYSDPSFYFDDYFTYGAQLIEAQQYETALGAWQLALEKMGRPLRMTEFIATKLASVSLELLGKNDISLSHAYAKTAYTLLPKSTVVQQTFSTALKVYYLHLANRENVAGIIAELNTYLSNSSVKNLALRAADSATIILALEENLASINGAIQIQKKLIEWDNIPEYHGSLAASFYNLYRYKSIRDYSTSELNSILTETMKYGQSSYATLKRDKKPYFNEHLVLLAAKNDYGKFDEAQRSAAEELGSSTALMSQDIMIRYRKMLAIAFTGLLKFDAAEAEYKTILSNAPSDRNVSLSLAEVLIAQKKYNDAKGIIQQLMLGNNDNALLIGKIGYIELLNGNFAEASFQLEKAIKELPSERSHYGFLADAYHLAGNDKKALRNYEVAIEYLDDMITGSGRRNLSESAFEELKSRRDKYALTAAKICEESNEHDKALKLYLSLTEVNPQNAAGWYGLGNSLHKAGRLYYAINAFDKALTIDGNNQTYKSAYSNEIKARENALQQDPGLKIIEVKVKDVYPVLYKNYADLHQLPVGEIVVANNSSSAITPTSITTFVAELMSQPTEVNASVIDPYSNQSIKLSAIFPEKILLNNDKKSYQMDVVVTFTVNGKTETIKKSTSFSVFGRNTITWSDKRLLSAFVTPNEEMLIEYNKKADAIFRNTSGFGLQRNMLKALQIYTLLSESGIGYSADPSQNYATSSITPDVLDYLQFPTETLKRKGGDCDDLVALAAALFENGGVPAAYIDLPGHVMLAFESSIKPSDIASNGINAREVVIIGDKVWIPLETTFIGNKNFMIAWKSGAERFYKELTAGQFPELIPFADAWGIYQPAAYKPEGFNEAPPSGKKVIDSYETMVAQLVQKTKKEAIAEIKNRYYAEGNNVFVKNKYATLLAQTGQMTDAENIFLEALKLSPENATVLNNLGNVFFLQGNNAKARDYYEQAAKLDVNDANILINLCKTCIALGDKVAAKTFLDKAIILDPEIAYIYADLNTQLK